MVLSKVNKKFLTFLEETRDNQNCIKKKTYNPDSRIIKMKLVENLNVKKILKSKVRFLELKSG